ncbi:helix-turn-helix domain-containing protein [Streptomyces sp. B3I8]|uniref:helix-turn-helix domain-containing protein n=1 Tax=Streptomyces sp. B3I8 TaxID=3042303 RepID=UPI00358FDE4A
MTPPPRATSSTGRSGRSCVTTPGAPPNCSPPWRPTSPRAAAPARSADRLHVHPNTVTQRLDRVRRLLDLDWSDPERTLDLQLALRLHRILRPATPGDAGPSAPGDADRPVPRDADPSGPVNRR